MESIHRMKLQARRLVALLLPLCSLLAAGRAHAATTFTPGDVFVSLKTGQVQWYHADGTVVGTLVGTVPGHAQGMGLDASSNLYVNHWCADSFCLTGNTVERFSPAGASLGVFGSGYSCNPTSIDFDAAGNVFVGQADCSGAILKFNAAGAPVTSFAAAPENRGSMWIELAPDSCTVLYASEGVKVKRYNVCANVQLTDFNTVPLPGSNAYGMVILTDNTVLVADSSAIVRLDAGGNVIQTYNTGELGHIWFSVDVDLVSTAFWAANNYTSVVTKFDLATGAVLASINTGAPQFEVKAVAVFHAPGAVTRRGRMTGGGSIFTDTNDSGVPSGTRITHGFELHCDANRQPNSLEINIHDPINGKFHLEKLTSATCYYDPSINPTPPPASFNTYVGKGAGSYNGVSGASAEWTFTDAGQPGVNSRIKRLKITDASGNVIVFVPDPGHTLTFGAHQAHQ